MKAEHKSVSLRLLSVVLSLCLLFTVAAPLTVFADEVTTEWVVDTATEKDGVVSEITDDGWTHLKAAPTNGNSTSDSNSYPAIFLNDSVKFGATGTFKFTMKTATPSSDRFGIYLGYNTPAKGMFFGYDTDGWFWQKYDGVSDEWYSGSRVSAPAADTETSVEINWADNKAKLIVNGAVVFEDVSYASFADSLTDKIGIKCASYRDGTQITDVYLKDIEITTDIAQKFNATGIVKDAKGEPVNNATVKVDSTVVHTDATGAFTVGNLVAGTYTAEISKNDFVTKSVEFTVTDADVTIPEITLEAVAKVVYGDVNEDGSIDAVDATLVLQKYAGIEVTGTYNAVNADVDGSGEVDSTDATLILQYYAEIITVFPVEESEPNPDIPDDPDAVEISSSKMKVQVDPEFPRVHKYTMLGANKGKEMAGQTDKLSVIKINDVDITPEVTSTVAADKSKITYVLTCKNDDRNIDCVLTIDVAVKDNTLEFKFVDIENKLVNTTYPVQTISIPNHSLVSVQSNQANANFLGSVISSRTYQSGDTYKEFTDETTSLGRKTFAYAVISNNELSASMESNSLYEGESAGLKGITTDSDNNRITTTIEDKEDCKSLGLSSSTWIYDTFLTSYDGKGTSEFVEYYDKENDMPYVRVAITGDENKDGKVNWNDGAIAFRSISHEIPGSESVPDHVTYRIAMNFGGQAQNPFLMTLDNVKKVALHTEGLGQSILLKGYGNEGHDSGHPDYADIGTRIGGTEDMLTLLKDGKNYGATFGIHINASEMYPEAKAFSEEMVRRDGDDLSYGWNWIDQGIGINGIYDLVSGNRYQRFEDLYNKVGKNLDFLYLDVWGNNTSGNEGTIPTRNIGHQMTSFDGWRMGNEWGVGFDWYATMQHWALDLAYGDQGSKGHNSALMRFIRNNQKDSWVIECERYGGAANAPLLGGMEMYDFEGWQGRNDYDLYIRTVYSHNITTKFIQHFDVTKWENSENSYRATVGSTEYEWTPEMYIELKDADGNLVTLTRGSDDVTTDAYRDRTITYNGVVISEGEVTSGRDWVLGTEKYLIPWFWDANGNELADEDMKLYHWSCLGGESTWELVDEWKDCKSVVVYELTDTGKTNPVTVNVVNGNITIDAKAETPYVVFKGEKAQMDIEWSTGMHINDASFNSGSLDAWTKAGNGTASIVKSQYTNPMLKLTGDVSMTQTLTDLTAGQEYAVYVGVDNRSDGAATITLTDGNGNVIDSNYTNRSIAKNYIKAYTHSTTSATVNGTSYFQNMYVYFTAPATGSVKLALSHEGTGDTYFDDIRVVENEFAGVEKDAEGKLVKFENDFENNAQGVYPFVIGGIEYVEDNRTHLSEYHAPYTQAGWDVKKLDDVIEGNWSIKVNGLVQRQNLVMQTIPQNIRFEPGVTYTVSFDYELGSDGTYVVVIGNGEYGTGTTQTIDLSKTLNNNISAGDIARVNTCTFTITGAENGQTWFGIYSTAVAPDTCDVDPRSSAANFGGYKEIVIDNVSVVKGEVTGTADKTALNAALDEAYAKNSVDYSDASWNAVKEAVKTAQNVNKKIDATQAEVNAAATALTTALNNLAEKSANLTVKFVDADNNPIAGAAVTLTTAGVEDKTATTDANGNAVFSNIKVRSYAVTAKADGFASVYGRSIGAIVEGQNNATVTLVAYTKAQNFDDVTDLTGKVENLTGNSGTAALAVQEGALRITFPGSGRNNVVLTEFGKLKNAQIEFDFTPAASAVRFGVVFRANDMNNRVFVGVGDSNDTFFAEHWKGSANSWTSMSSGDALEANQTYHIVASMDNNILTLVVNDEVVFSGGFGAACTQDAGYVGFECRSSAAFTIDNIKVADLGE